MSILKCLVAGISLIPAASAALAHSIDQDTPCEAIVKILEAPALDQQRVKEVLDYTLETMQGVDHLHRLKGQIEIFPQMSEDGRVSLALIAIRRCQDRPAVPLADTAIETYEAIRGKRASLGLNGQQQKLAHAVTPRRLRRAHVSGQESMKAPDRPAAAQKSFLD